MKIYKVDNQEISKIIRLAKARFRLIKEAEHDRETPITKIDIQFESITITGVKFHFDIYHETGSYHSRDIISFYLLGMDEVKFYKHLRKLKKKADESRKSFMDCLDELTEISFIVDEDDKKD